MKIALFQSPTTNGDEVAAFSRIAQMLQAAAWAGAEMLVMPELYLPGYNRPDLHPDRAQPKGGVWEDRLSRLCKESHCGLTIGWAERDGDAVFNVASCYHKTGEKLAHHRKLQLFGPMENAVFTPGDHYTVFDLGPFRAALLICYDVEFAHHVQALAAQGVNLILVPTANPAGFEAVNRLLVPARANEFRLTIAYANYVGVEGDVTFGGGSVIVGPNGAPLAEAGQGEALLICDLGVISNLDPAWLSTQLQDRRDLPHGATVG
ncbi:MAG: carbon-nitrogen hydrolase family protein [Pseudomonadota bacterium]